MLFFFGMLLSLNARSGSIENAEVPQPEIAFDSTTTYQSTYNDLLNDEIFDATTIESHYNWTSTLNLAGYPVSGEEYLRVSRNSASSGIFQTLTTFNSSLPFVYKPEISFDYCCFPNTGAPSFSLWIIDSFGASRQIGEESYDENFSITSVSITVDGLTLGSYAHPFQVQWWCSGLTSTNDFILFDNIRIRVKEYSIAEDASSVPFSTETTIRVNVTPSFDSGDLVQGATLEYDYDHDYTNGIAGAIANNTPLDNQLNFTIPSWAVRWGDSGGFWYRIHMWDASGNHRFSTNMSIVKDANIAVTDAQNPACSFVWQNPSISPNQDLYIRYNILDQTNASGFDFVKGNVTLRYKIGSTPPSNNLDYTGQTRYDWSLNTGLDINGSIGSGSVNFTIYANNYTTGDTIWHWVNASDRAGNKVDTYGSRQSINVTNIFLPAIGNEANQSFEHDKYITFTNTSALQDATVLLNWANLTGGRNDTLSPYSHVENNWTFRIPKEFAHFGRLNEEVYFWINGTDMSGRKHSQSYKYYVTDLQAPIAEKIWENYTNNKINYAGNSVYIRVNCTDPDIALETGWRSTASNLTLAVLYVQNSTDVAEQDANKTSVYDTSHPVFSNISINGQYQHVVVGFEINDTYLSARNFNDVYYLIQVWDGLGNVFNITGNFTVQDLIAPTVNLLGIYSQAWQPTVNYDENIIVSFNIAEPSDASGFRGSAWSQTKLFYKINKTLTDHPTSPADYDGWRLADYAFPTENGGILNFTILEGNYTYNSVVWIWANISDGSDNNWSMYVAFPLLTNRIILDNKLPTCIIISNDDDNSYHVVKLTQIVPAEPADASGLLSIRLYWRVNSPVTFPGGYTNFIDVTGFSKTGGVTLTINIPTTDFVYGRSIHYVFQINDSAGNVFITTDRSFLIIDALAPNYSTNNLNSLFFWNVNGKSKNFTFNVSDPDYLSGRSSGIDRVDFYYKLGSGVWVFNGTQSPGIGGGYVTFTIPYNATFADRDLYYKILVYDGNQTLKDSSVWESPPWVIYVANGLSVEATNPKPLSQWGSIYYKNSLGLTISFTFTSGMGGPYTSFMTSVYYQIGTGAVTGPFLSEGNTITITLPSLPQGTHTVALWHHNSTFIGQLTFKLDVTPPAKVPSLSAILGDAGVQLEWSKITDEDTVSYAVYRGFSPNFDVSKGEGILVISGILGNNFVDDDILLDLTTYYYQVYAIDPAGNLSAEPATTSLLKPFPAWIWIIMAGIAVGLVAGLVVLKRARADRKLILATMEKADKTPPVTKDEEWNRVVAASRKRQESVEIRPRVNETSIADDGLNWAPIQTTAAPKPTTPKPAPTGRSPYWKGELEELLAKVFQAEEVGNYAEELRVLDLVQRIAQQMQDQETVTMVKQKIQDVWAMINAQN